jgi:prepilin-type N-terminal cleavage/methylation domain-containing protein
VLRVRRTHSQAQAGFTLVEVLVTMVIMVIVSGMLIATWFALQSSYARTVSADDARSMARDALARITAELRDAQPPTLSGSGQAVFTAAQPMEVDFYSSYNQPGTSSDGSGIGTLRLTRIYLDTSGSSPQKTLYWQRDTNNNSAFDSGDRRIALATEVVNNSITDTSVTPNTSYTAIFTYFYRDTSGNLQPATSIAAGSLASIVAVKVRLIVDDNLNHSPVPADLQGTVRPRNAPQS